jgi:hypothetical protein
MNVFIQLMKDCKEPFVLPDDTGFEVIELQDGTSDACFVYRMVAKRKGFESKRFDYWEAAENDPYLDPELHGSE